MEKVEAEARYSYEETEDNSRVQLRQFTKQSMSAENSGQNSGFPTSMLMPGSPKTLVPAVEALNIKQEDTVPSKVLYANFEDYLMDNESLCIRNKNSSDRANAFSNCNVPRKTDTQDGEEDSDSVMEEAIHQNSPISSDNPIGLDKEGNGLSLGTSNRSFMSSDATEMKSSSLGYSGKAPRRSVSAEELSRRIGLFDRSSLVNDIPSLTLKQDTNSIESAGIQNTTFNTDLHHMEGPCSELPQKRKVSTFSSLSPKSGFKNSDIADLHNSLAISVPAQCEIPLLSVACQNNYDCQLNDMKNVSDVAVPTCPTNQKKGSLISISAALGGFVKHESALRADDTTYLKGQFMGFYHNARSTVTPHDQRSTFDRFSNLNYQAGTLSSICCKLTNSHHDFKPVVATGKKMGNAVDNLGTLSIDGKHEDAICPKRKIPEASLLKTSELPLRPDKGDISMTKLSDIETGEMGKTGTRKGKSSSSCSTEDSAMEKVANTADPSCKRSSKILTKKVVAKKKLSCRSELSAEYQSDGRSFVYTNEVSPNESTPRTEHKKKRELQQKGSSENNDLFGTVAKDKIVELVKKGQNSASESDRIGVNENHVANFDDKNVMNESASKSKEIQKPVLKERAVDENRIIMSVCDGVLMRGKLTKAHHSLNNRRTKNLPTVVMQVPNDAEKENKPAENVSMNKDKRECQNISVNRGESSGQNSGTIVETTICEGRNQQPCKVISEPARFILSGHRLQRKEFQIVIRRLRGRLCRDSHTWSYQATHFIVPDPIRRTEKFFAAVASGRWILKTDYLTACQEAGNFLVEEPFEWYGSGLTEDGTINLEAPRKWRLLRERTGHGAFYGMRIISYGDCIAPSLETLKRVMKAGDGMILATYPPYTRFLKSGVDFAVVSPGMPHVDTWIQEFLRHEIPCVLADYLVEFVCKPGYPLDQHILYKTHVWAETSLAKLLSRLEGVITAEDPGTLCEDSDDLSCSVCGSRERGDVMLICGDEGGFVGCGIGTHIDCCDPPLDAVPEEDWFCPKCSGRVRKASIKGRRKR
uniref:BRCT domain-containing protein At4g02110 n=1 Tax=Anthurium amnicola TaxID=1678845 RepID=A0A1D1Z144_9ARAE